MGLKVSEGGNFKRQLIEEGVHVARCYLIADIGTQLVSWKEETHERHKVVIGWEIPDQLGTFTIDDVEQQLPLVINKTYTMTLSTKGNLRKDLEAWRGKKFTAEELQGFDLKNILGAPCQLQVIHAEVGDKTYANIGSIMSLPKGMAAPEAVAANQWFSLDEGNDIPEDIPKWIVEKIHASKEWIATEGEPDGEPVDTAPEENVKAAFDGQELDPSEQLPF